MTRADCDTVLSNPVKLLFIEGKAEDLLGIAGASVAIGVLCEASWTMGCTKLSISMPEESVFTLLTFIDCAICTLFTGRITRITPIVSLIIEESNITLTIFSNLCRVVDTLLTVIPVWTVSTSVIKAWTTVLFADTTLCAGVVTGYAEVSFEVFVELTIDKTFLLSMTWTVLATRTRLFTLAKNLEFSFFYGPITEAPNHTIIEVGSRGDADVRIEFSTEKMLIGRCIVQPSVTSASKALTHTIDVELKAGLVVIL